MAKENRTKIGKAIETLLTRKSEISVGDVAQYLKLSKSDEADRKAVRRAIELFVKDGILEPRGAARSRVYVLKKIKSGAILEIAAAASSIVSVSDSNQLIPSSAQDLLEYLDIPFQRRKPVGYNQQFLRSYQPNKTAYLAGKDRQKLLELGRLENRERPAGTYARNIYNRLLIDLSWNSSRLEGNTYSLLETQRLIELGENAEGKDILEALMILNHKGAIEYIIESATAEDISRHDIYSIHAILSDGLLKDPSASGRLREKTVGIEGSPYIPMDNPHMLRESFEIFLDKLNHIENPFEQSFFSHVHISYMQAFEDVNKRTARLVANIPLIKKNLCPLSFVDVEKDFYVKSLLGIYERNDISLSRDLYIQAYERSSLHFAAIQQSLGKPDIFRLKYRDQLHDIVRKIIQEEVKGRKLPPRVRSLIEDFDLSARDAEKLFKMVEIEILHLHEGNIARFKIRPSEFYRWKILP